MRWFKIFFGGCLVLLALIITGARLWEMAHGRLSSDMAVSMVVGSALGFGGWIFWTGIKNESWI